MEKKQTAVEWLIEHLTAIGHLEIPQGSNIVTAIISEAKEMEKEQIMMAVKESWYMAKGSNFQEPQEKQYYNETYGSKD